MSSPSLCKKCIQVFVLENGRTNLYRLEEDSSVQNLIELISSRSKIPQEGFFLIHAGKVLDASKNLDFYGISEASSLTLSIRNFNNFPQGNLLRKQLNEEDISCSSTNAGDLEKPSPIQRQITGHKWDYGFRISQDHNCPTMVQIDYRKGGEYYYVMLPDETPCQGFYDEIVELLSEYGYTWADIKQFDH